MDGTRVRLSFLVLQNRTYVLDRYTVSPFFDGQSASRIGDSKKYFGDRRTPNVGTRRRSESDTESPQKGTKRHEEFESPVPKFWGVADSAPGTRRYTKLNRKRRRGGYRQPRA